MSNAVLHPEIFLVTFGPIWDAFGGPLGWFFGPKMRQKNMFFGECILHAVWLAGWRHPGDVSPGDGVLIWWFLGSGGGYNMGKLSNWELIAENTSPECWQLIITSTETWTLITDNNQYWPWHADNDQVWIFFQNALKVLLYPVCSAKHSCIVVVKSLAF